MFDYFESLNPFWDGPEDGLDPDDVYLFVMWWRRAVMILSSSLLIINIFMIIKFKQYLYNTLKMFLFLQIFTVIGQLSVLTHTEAFHADKKYFIEPEESPDTIIETIIEDHPSQMLPCSLEAYFNLFSYNVSYLFALLITLYVRRVIDNDHKNFMRKNYRFILYVVVGTLLVYFPPLLLSFFHDVPYSFGPVGFEIKSKIFSGQTYNYLFYCGITRRREDFWGIFLSIFNMALIPVIMFFIHCSLLYRNRRSMKFLRGLQELNPRQWFILKSGTLSVFIFVFQSINFIKFVLSLIDSDSAQLICIVGFMNMIFDFVPIVLVWVYYKKYYAQGRKLQERNLLKSLSDDSFITHQILQY